MGFASSLVRLPVSAFRALRYVEFSLYYAAADLNHRHELYASRKRAGPATFRSYEPSSKHCGDVLLRRLLSNCRAGDVVVDAGANTGVYSLAVAAATPDATVVAFEPNPRVCDQLRTNVRRNGFGSRIDVRNLGLGDESATRTFYRSNYGELGSFNAYNAGAWEARVEAAVPIEIRRLDDLVSDGAIPPPDHLKIDVEGFGYEVLSGASETLRAHRPVVYFEPHRIAAGIDRDDECAAFLSAHGYRVRTRGDAWLCEPI
ncbi:FkbM family methyltransferase [Halegenticoccus tardaugens]|uniref:FkbM family methyltransferase n=1 Tax=Halegenticoccus tardaugens TaxID=2071624 RepID=UPI00100B4FE3|nr:FkbM family methyltransferase [Halegenticoccus tardaugens]